MFEMFLFLSLQRLNSIALARNVDPDMVQQYIKHAKNSLNLRRKAKTDDQKVRHTHTKKKIFLNTKNQ